MISLFYLTTVPPLLSTLVGRRYIVWIGWTYRLERCGFDFSVSLSICVLNRSCRFISSRGEWIIPRSPLSLTMASPLDCCRNSTVFNGTPNMIMHVMRDPAADSRYV